MIGLKSLAAITIVIALVTIAALRGVLDMTYLEHLSGAAAFAVGLVAAAGLGLVTAAWRPDVRSRAGLALRGGRPTVIDVSRASTRMPEAEPASQPAAVPASQPSTSPTERAASQPSAVPPASQPSTSATEHAASQPSPAEGAASQLPTSTARRAASEPPPPPRRDSTPAIVRPREARPRELPGIVQRALLLAGFIAIALGALTNHAAARIAELRDRWSEPSPSTYCLPQAPKPKAAEPEPPPPEVVEQQGCALVRRAYALGYAKTLGSCAPKTVAAVIPKPAIVREVCTRRQLDEPFLHYGFRRVAGAVMGATETNPIDGAEHRIAAIRTHVDYLGSLVADIRHAITGTPHAAHHIWTNLPDPHPRTLRELLVGAPRCSTRFASLPLWPRFAAGQESDLVEHVLGQLLFATRFGSTASCNDYVIHWDAPADACAHPDALLADRSLRDVVDRRRRQLDLVALAKALGREPPPAPPPIGAVVSLQCFVVDTATGSFPSVPATSTLTSASAMIDGEALPVRTIHVQAIRLAGDGRIDIYVALATLLAGGSPLANAPANGTPPTGAPPTGADLFGDDFMLARLDQLAMIDPFTSRFARAAIARDDLLDVYPIERHLHAFIDAFRRRYLAQRGRL